MPRMKQTGENTRHCIDCIHFKTREILKSKLAQEDVDFRGSYVVINGLKHHKSVTIFYCSHERKPLMESPRIYDRLRVNCEKAEGFNDTSNVS